MRGVIEEVLLIAITVVAIGILASAVIPMVNSVTSSIGSFGIIEVKVAYYKNGELAIYVTSTVDTTVSALKIKNMETKDVKVIAFNQPITIKTNQLTRITTHVHLARGEYTVELVPTHVGVISTLYTLEV